ncbi:MAG TPA: cytochrome c, partial [Terriglobales bacterium]|nr:cytochrome c [Terriglobales bacterium]
ISRGNESALDCGGAELRCLLQIAGRHVIPSEASGPSLKLQIARPFKVFALALLMISVGCRQDMHDQPRFKPLRESDFYADLRSARPPVEGTVARGQLHEDAYFYSGKIGNNPGDYMPFPVTQEVLVRGQERYNIYCTPCHSRLGEGNGMIVQRGFRRPPSFHTDRLRKAPLGYFFDVMTNGFGAMPDYASQISPDDRWRIVAYIRALQLSQGATMADVPAEQNVPSEPPRFREPGSGATLTETEPPSNKIEERK